MRLHESLGLACGAHISPASVFWELTASSPLHRASLGWWSWIGSCPCASKQDSGYLFFFPAALSHLF